MDRMLEKPGVVAHGEKMTNLHLWLSLNVRRRALVEPRNHPEPMPLLGALESSQVTLRGSLPCHRSAARICALAHRLPPRIVG